jgi:hypothetical protein
MAVPDTVTAEGENLFPLTPTPENVPPLITLLFEASLALNVIAASLLVNV